MKVGDYVRTNNGGIGKIIKCPFKSMYLDEIWGDIENIETIITNDVYKSSPNIIDLIEVGDYVNGLKVSKVGGTYHGKKDKAIYCDYCVDKETGKWTMIYDDEIKSIVTKEQFESVEYKI